MNNFEKRVARLAMIALDPYTEGGDPPAALIDAIASLSKESEGELSKTLGALVTMYTDDLAKWPESNQRIALALKEFSITHPDASTEEQHAHLNHVFKDLIQQ